MPYINVNDAYILDNTGKQVDDAVDYALANSNRNLLDNPFFTVNQRNFTSVNYTTATTPTYCVDRWMFGGQGTLTYNSDKSLTINITSGNYGGLSQRFDPIYKGLNVTFSILLTNGTVVSGNGQIPSASGLNRYYIALNGSTWEVLLRSNDSTWWIELRSNVSGATATIRAVKLELGSYSTLANDVPPDYAEELTKCRYYFRRISNTSGYTQLWLLGRNRSTTGADFHGALGNQPMRTAPTISKSGSIYVQNSDTNIAITDLTRYFTVSSDFVFRATVASGLTANEPSALALGSGAYIDLSADL